MSSKYPTLFLTFFTENVPSAWNTLFSVLLSYSRLQIETMCSRKPSLAHPSFTPHVCMDPFSCSILTTPSLPVCLSLSSAGLQEQSQWTSLAVTLALEQSRKCTRYHSMWLEWEPWMLLPFSGWMAARGRGSCSKNSIWCGLGLRWSHKVNVC